MRNGMRVAALAGALALSGCGGGGGGGTADAPPPLTGVDVVTPGIESYVTDHNGYARVRTTPGTEPGDAAVLAQIDEALMM